MRNRLTTPECRHTANRWHTLTALTTMLCALAASASADISGARRAALIDLYLDHNRLCGSIPTAIGNLVDLLWLNLGSNRRSGALPHDMKVTCTAVTAASEVGVVRVDVLGDYADDAIPRMDYAALAEGTVAMVHGEGAWPAIRSIYYQELAVGGALTTETVTAYVGSMFDALVVVDSDGAPHVLVDSMVYDGGYRRQVLEFVHDGGGGWSSTIAFDSSDNNAALVAAAAGPGGAVHAVMCNRFEARLYHAATSGGSWHTDSLPYEANARFVNTVDLAVDAAGHAHIAYDVENLASNPSQRPELRYVSDTSGSWQRVVIFPQGNTAWSLHVGPSIAVDATGTPLVASTFGETAASGSLSYSQLRLNRRVGAGTWTSEVVADQSDSFAAGDGAQFTGWRPQLLVGPDGQHRILFSDMACWHEPLSQYCQRGQIRLAHRDGNSWSLLTLYPQPVNAGSYLDRMRLEAALDAPAAGRLYVLALEGAAANAGWTGTFRRLRLHVAPATLFADGFESGDTSAWSAP